MCRYMFYAHAGRVVEVRGEAVHVALLHGQGVAVDVHRRGDRAVPGGVPGQRWGARRAPTARSRERGKGSPVKIGRRIVIPREKFLALF